MSSLQKAAGIVVLVVLVFGGGDGGAREWAVVHYKWTVESSLGRATGQRAQ